MRKKQLKVIAYSYLAANMLVVVELALLFGIKNPAMANCAKLCAQPNSNAAALLLFTLMVIHLIPTHLFLYSFYLLPRRFFATREKDVQLVGDAGLLNQPLLGEQLHLMEDDINWQMDHTPR